MCPALLRSTVVLVGLLIALAFGQSGCSVQSAGVKQDPESQLKGDEPQNWVIFKNVRVFDGETVKDGLTVSVADGRIKTVGGEPPVPAKIDRVSEIDCTGKDWVLMPGLIDAHVHCTVGLSTSDLLNSDNTYVALRGAAELEMMLDRGFTSVRDMGGNTFGLKRAIDEGRVRGPRIFPSGAIISQTSGHGDYRLPSDRPRRFGGPFGRAEQLGVAIVADGKDEVLVATREQLRLGATQIKLAVGGGVVSSFDPVDVNEYSTEEIGAAVSAADNWGTYVAVHVYTAAGCKKAVEAGVLSLEHATLIDAETMECIAKKNADYAKAHQADPKKNPKKTIFLSPQVLSFKLPFTTEKKMQQRNDDVARGITKMFELAQKHNVRVCLGTDLLLAPQAMAAQSAELTARANPEILKGHKFTAIEVLKQATLVNGELLGLSWKREPALSEVIRPKDEDQPAETRSIKIGVIAPGAVADLLLVNGDPTQNLSLLVDWDPWDKNQKSKTFLEYAGPNVWDPTKSIVPPSIKNDPASDGKFGKNLFVIMKGGLFHKTHPEVKKVTKSTN